MDKGGSDTVTQTSQNAPPDWLVPYMQEYLSNSAGLAGQPYQQSPFPQIAPVNDYQNTAWQMMYDRAMNGSPESNAGRAALTGIASGDQANPWQSLLPGIATGQSQNPYLAGLLGFNANSNPFMGGMQSIAGGQMNPNTIDPTEFIKSTSADMTNAAQKGVMAQTDAAANRQGAYGGSAYSQMQADNAGALADSIGQMSSQAKLSAAQHNAGLWQQNQGNRLAAMGLGNNAYLGGQGLNLQGLVSGGNMFDQGIGRQLQAIGLGGQMFQNDVGNMLSAAGMAPAYGQMDQSDFAALNGAGNQLQGYQQGLLGSMNGEFQNQVQYPYQQNNYMGQAIGNMMGNYGTSTSSQTQPGQDPFTNILGLATSFLPFLPKGMKWW